MKTPTYLGLILLTVGMISSAVPLATFPVSGSSAKCQPTYNLSMTPTSTSVTPGSNASFVATVQSVCKLQTITIQYFRSLTPQVTNGPLLTPPPSCYHGCNILTLYEGATIFIKTTAITTASTPAGTYTFTLTVNPDDCSPAYPVCPSAPTTVSSTLTVT